MTSKHSHAPVLVSQGVFDLVKTFSEFEQRVSALFDTNTKAQGDAFEIFVEAYLATQPILQCQETWLVGDIPVDVRESLNLPNDAKGIDGVYRSTLNNLIPYQVKFRSNRPALGFNEVAPFLGITEKATDRLLITNCDTIAIDVKNRTGIRSLRGVDFDQLSDEDFTVIENWLKQKPKKRQPLKPDPYQDEALKNIANHLETNDRGTVVMACGTGKTLVALWAVEQSKAKSILVLVPSLTLLQQTLEEWSVHNSWGKDFSYLCVCSDPSVNLKNDEIEIDPSDVPFRIDTDPEIVRRYLAQDNGKTKIVFSTYQSSQVVSQATKGLFEFDIAIFDEAHKTTGSADGRFAFSLKDENIKIRKRLFLTATPKHYDISKRDKDGEFKFASMDDEAVYGKRAHTLTFGEAARKGIICPYKVVITLIDKKQVDDFALKNGITLVEGDSVKAKWVASQIAISSAIKHTNATKIITFHSRVKTAREFASDEVNGVKKFVENFDVFHVHGKQKSNERKDTISKFRKASRSIITNAKCLTEGVDVPAVDMVAFVDPRHSKIDIAQAVGRAMRKPRGSDKKVGYIVVPIFAKDTSGHSVEIATKSEDFDDVALILNSLIEQDEELVEIIRELKQAKGRGELFNPKKLKDKVEVIGPLIGLDELTNSIYVEAVDRLGESWDEWFGLLVAWRIETDKYVPEINDDFRQKKLGVWAGGQRSNYKKRNLAQHRIEKLEGLNGWSWNLINDLWLKGYQSLEIYFKENGSTRVPDSYKTAENFNLGSWAKTRRLDYKRGRLDQDKIAFLEIFPDWSWDPNFDDWLTTYQEVKELLISKSLHEIELGRTDPNLKTYAGWLISQKRNYLAWENVNEDSKPIYPKLSNEQISYLEELPGWTWDRRKEVWNANFLILNNFLQIDSFKSITPLTVHQNFSLGRWIVKQRQAFKEGKLESWKKELLESLNWVADPFETQWNETFQILEKYLTETGTAYVPQNLTYMEKRLGAWVSSQRQDFKIKKLSLERIEKLQKLHGWSWDATDMAAHSISKKGLSPSKVRRSKS
jgi:superfamily II DNA or RNA helicase